MDDYLHFGLIDTDLSYIIVSDDIEVEIEYGRFALSLINTDYDKLLNCLEDFFKNNKLLQLAEQLQAKESYHNKKIKPDIAPYVFKGLNQPLTHVLAKDYLAEQQAKAIVRLLLWEMMEQITEQKIQLNNIGTLIPPVFSDKNLHQYIKDSLLKKSKAFTSEIQENLNSMDITTSIKVLDDGTPVTVYYLKNTLSFLVLDLQKYLLSSRQVKECEHCGRLFYPDYRNSEKYCKLKHEGTDLTCGMIRHRVVDDEFAKLAKTARGYQYSRCHNASTQKKYDVAFLEQIYFKWSIECTDNYYLYRKNKDKAGFEQWIKETRFTADRIKTLYQEYNKK